MSGLVEDRKEGVDVPPADTEKPVVEGSFVEGLFVPADGPVADHAAGGDEERLDEIANASMPPGGTYS